MRFALIDLSNLFRRACYATIGDPESQAMALLTVFRSLRKLYREFAIDHLVFAVDYGSWRHAIYPAYKSRRRLQTTRQQEAQQASFMTLDALQTYLATGTRCTVLKALNVEGDDFIARWIVKHPRDEHVIVSGDSDFVQLLNRNVRIFDAMNQRILDCHGVLDMEGHKHAFSVSPKDGKIKVGEPAEDFIPETDWWRKALFVKLVRGDINDSVFSAYPGVRYEGKKHSIRAAWEDRIDQGFHWNNLMFQTWDKLMETGDVQQVRVIDEFRINEHLIDLTKQPLSIIQTMDSTIDEAINRTPIQQIGRYFLQFCAKQDIPALAKEASDHVTYLNAPYRSSSSE